MAPGILARASRLAPSLLAPGAAVAVAAALGIWLLATEPGRGLVTGTVRARDGARPIAGAVVSFEDAQGVRRSAVTGTSGAFRSWLPPGRYRALEKRAGFRPITADEVVVGAEPVRMRFDLGRDHGGTVTVLGGSGRSAGPSRDFALQFRGFGGPYRPGDPASGFLRARDASGDPVAGMAVAWRAIAVGPGGRAAPIAAGRGTTDDTGRLPVHFRARLSGIGLHSAQWASGIRLLAEGTDDLGRSASAETDLAGGLASLVGGRRLPPVGNMETELIAPTFAREGDRLLAAGLLTNGTPFAQTVRIAFRAPGFDRAAPEARNLRVGPGDAARFEWPLRVASASSPAASGFLSSVTLTASRLGIAAVATGAIGVEAVGRVVGQAWSGSLGSGLVPDEAGAAFDPPAGRAGVVPPRLTHFEFGVPAGAAAVRLTLQLAASPRAAAAGAYDGLAVEKGDTSDLAAARLLAGEAIGRAASRAGLRAAQNADGGWGWWPGGPSVPDLSAFVMRALDGTGDRFEAAAAYLARSPEPDGLADAVWALGPRAPGALRDRAFAGRKHLGDAALARLVEGLARAGDSRALQALAELDLRATEEGALTYWKGAAPESLGRDWDAGPIEATAQAILAHTTHEAAAGSAPIARDAGAVPPRPTHTEAAAGSAPIARDAGAVPPRPTHLFPADAVAGKAARWLLRARHGETWGAPRVTGLAIAALASLGGARAGAAPVAIVLDGHSVGTVTVAGDRPLRFALGGDRLAPGKHRLGLVGGPGVTFAASLGYLEPGRVPEARQGQFLDIRREYHAIPRSRLARAGGLPLQQVAARLDRWRPAGTRIGGAGAIVVRLRVKVRQTLRFVRITDPLPAGMAPVALPPVRGYRLTPQGAAMWVEAESLSPGDHDFVYALRPRVSGSCRVPPPIAEVVNAPDMRARGDASSLELGR